MLKKSLRFFADLQIHGAPLGALFVVALALAASGCNQKTGGPDSSSPAAPVMWAEAETKDIPVELSAVGTVKSYASVELKSLVSGRLQRINFREGHDVREGDILFVIDKKPFEASLRQAEAAFEKNTHLAKRAREQAERYANLKKEDAISNEAYEEATTSANALAAQVKADAASVESLSIQLENCDIRAPFGGRTGQTAVDEGALVKAYDTALVSIEKMNPIYAEFSVPENRLGLIRENASRGKVKVKAFASGGAEPEAGTLTFIDSGVNSETGSVMLKAEFGNSGRRLWPGQFVNIAIDMGFVKNAVAVPDAAIQTGQSGQYVYVIKQDMTVEFRPIASSFGHAGYAAIEKGLAPGEKVVTDGHLRLFPGAKAALKNSPAVRRGSL